MSTLNDPDLRIKEEQRYKSGTIAREKIFFTFYSGNCPEKKNVIGYRTVSLATV